MSFRGRGGGRGGGDRGGRGGGGFRGRGGGGRGGGGGGRGFDAGPPEEVVEVGEFTHTCEDDIVCSNTSEKIPYFNAPIYFENKEQIGKVDEIFGTPKDNGFTVTLQNGVKASSFKASQKVYIDPYKLLPIERFLPQAPGARGRGRGRGGDRGGRGGGDRGGRGGFGRGGGGDRGGFRGGRGGDRGGRGGFGDRGGRGGFGDRGGRGGGFRGGDRGGRGGGFRGDRGGGFKRSFDNGGGSGGGQNKKIKFDD